ncbi:muscle M-line assembly protein unc-89 [Drosophila eugracilis]|uniref:muscle M-line assembly protein unc-89 n=1 Tax=Drosophila eugracilis TaxID=29029 RepID=UPI001BD9F943|nr:muscle M-line assembly protein unc-89 [Drosophila eugracilis]
MKKKCVGTYIVQIRPLKRDRERSSYDKIYDSDDLESCISDCPHHHRVLFTDLRICKNKRKYNSRQRSGRSDFFVDGHIRPKTCNTCQRYVPLERDRQEINKYCTPCNAKEKIKTKSEKSLKESKIICCRPGKSAPIFVKNRHNPLVTDPIFNSYDKHMLENFEKFKEKNKPAQCIEKCPFPDYFTQSKENIPASALSSDCRCEIIPEEYSPPCDCQSVESIEHEDNRKTKSKISFFSCCTKSPKDESKSKPELQKEEKTESKSSGFSCLKRKEKTPQDNSKSEKKTKSSGLSFFKENEKKTAENPNEKNCSKSKEFSCFKQKERNPKEKEKQKNATPSKKSTGFLCFKKSEKRQKDDRPKSQEKSFGGKNEKIKMEEGNHKSSKSSRLFGWCRKSKAAKESNLKTEKAPSATECSCPPSEDQEIPVINSAVQFRCPCAPKEIDDGDVKVLYDSSFRFQNESCSCGEIPKTIYCHSDAQTPGQDTSDWYASSHAASTTSRSQFEEQEISYCPCASANGFYKIVR